MKACWQVLVLAAVLATATTSASPLADKGASVAAHRHLKAATVEHGRPRDFKCHVKKHHTKTTKPVTPVTTAPETTVPSVPETTEPVVTSAPASEAASNVASASASAAASGSGSAPATEPTVPVEPASSAGSEPEEPATSSVPETTTAPATTTAPTTAPDSDAPATIHPAGSDSEAGSEASTPTTVPTTTKPSTTVPTTTTKPVTTTPAATSAPISSNGTVCGTPTISVVDLNVGVTVDANEDEAGLKILAIAPKPSGGSYIAFMSSGKVQVMELDASDKLVSTTPISITANDFGDIYADSQGFVVLGTRDAQGGGTLNCGNPSNLCGTAPSPAIPCYDMYLIRYVNGKETWATKLTSSSASLPPYSTSATGPQVNMIWWYAHHGRLASDGTNFAAYFGNALSVTEGGCINIHQGDRMQVVSPSGSLVQSSDAFGWGCSHSGYERIVYDSRSKQFMSICKTDNNNRIKFPMSETTIYPVNLEASNLGDIVLDTNAGGYWMTVSNSDSSNAKVHLVHFLKNKASDKDIVLGGAQSNERATHLSAFGKDGMLAVWEGSSAGGDLAEGASRQMYVQVLQASDGSAVGKAIPVSSGVVGNRYQAFKTFPDGSVAYLSKGASNKALKLMRVKC